MKQHHCDDPNCLGKVALNERERKELQAWARENSERIEAHIGNVKAKFKKDAEEIAQMVAEAREQFQEALDYKKPRRDLTQLIHVRRLLDPSWEQE
ncbi:MAG: hypothetical protein FD180_3188 [Planctomycetota bacterium]|nr:MAG: hypothetical protein FD180_3188 [Planctomycetota bacterium]